MNLKNDTTNWKPAYLPIIILIFLGVMAFMPILNNISKESSAIKYTRGYEAFLQGDLVGAKKYFTEATALNPDDAQLKKNLCLINSIINDYDDPACTYESTGESEE